LRDKVGTSSSKIPLKVVKNSREYLYYNDAKIFRGKRHGKYSNVRVSFLRLQGKKLRGIKATYS